MNIRLSELIGEIVATVVILAFIIGGIVLWFFEMNATANEPIQPKLPEPIVEAQIEHGGE
ncbi:MAG: hypothetical protein IKG93_11390 [Clostridiales bacterium]|nr:hypothetical protein [Clostridiales bacterium]